MEKEQLITHTADIVVAHLANNTVAITDLPAVIERVHEALAGLGNAREEERQPKSPAISIRASLKPDYLVCLECGRKQKTLRRHIQTAHDMTPEQYRKEYGLPTDYPMTAPNYSARRKELAKASGLGRKTGTKKSAGKRRDRKPAAAPSSEE